MSDQEIAREAAKEIIRLIFEVDVDDMDAVKELRKDIGFASEMRKNVGRATWVGVSAFIGLIVIAMVKTFWGGLPFSGG